MGIDIAIKNTIGFIRHVSSAFGFERDGYETYQASRVYDRSVS